MYLAWREIRFAKTRYALIVTIMLLVSFLVLFVTGLARGLAYANASSVMNMPVNTFVVQQDSDRRFTRSELSQGDLETVRSMVNSASTTPFNLRMTAVTDKETTAFKADITLFAMNMKSPLMPAAVEGQAPTNDTQGQVMADRKLKEQGAHLGSILVDQMTGSEWTISGFVANESYSHTPSVFMNEQDWMQLQSKSAEGGRPASAQSYNAIALQLTGNQANLLQKKLPDAEVITKSQAVSAVPGYKEEQGSLLMMIAFLFVISAMVLAVFFYVITIQKTSQFGILKAIGARTAYLARNVVGQVLLLSVGSLAISLLLIRLMYAVLPASMPFELNASTVLLTCVLFIAMSLVGSLLSVIKVARTDALDAIGRVAG